MKSYLQGLITGGALVLAFMVLTGQKHGHKDNHGHHDIDDIMHKLEDLEGRIKNIEVGEEIFNSYIDTTLPKNERKKILLSQFEFECKCSLCLGRNDLFF